MSVLSFLESIVYSLCPDVSITVRFLDKIRHPLLSEAPSSNALGSPHLWLVMYTLICLCDDYVNALELLNY